MNIYIWNLGLQFMDEDLEELFRSYGRVAAASTFKDKRTGKCKGSGFVEMPSEAEARAAIAGLNGTEQRGRILIVEESILGNNRPRSNPGFADSHSGVHGGGKESWQTRMHMAATGSSWPWPRL